MTTESIILDISVIYLGDELPKYLLENLKYLKRTFPGENFVFISDSEKSLNAAREIGVDTWKFTKLDEIQERYQSHLNHDWNFRANFWFNTLARFFVINEFMKTRKTSGHLHLEADNFLFPDFPFDYFKNVEKKIAFPMESKNMGVASLLFLPNYEASNRLIQYSIDEIVSNRRATDMTILGKLANDREIPTSKLRVLPKELSNSLLAAQPPHYFSAESQFEGVFDAITHGQYLLGVDPRNFRGLRKVYTIQPTHAVRANFLSYRYSEEKGLHLSFGNQHWKIYNLHNHSKDLRLYSDHYRRRVLLKRVNGVSHEVKIEFLIGTFLNSVYSSLKRRVHRKF